MRKGIRVLALILAVLAVCGCSKNPAPVAQPDLPPPADFPVQEWPTKAPEELGFSQDLLETMEEQASNYDITNILIVRNGYKVYHRFVHKDYMLGENNLLPVYSCTKSISSALIGIALEEGYIQSIDQKISDFFPEWQELPPDELRDSITIKHLLTQTSGWDWPEFTTWNYRLTPLKESEDWVRFVLNREMAAEPGTVFNYSTGGSHLLSVIIERATGMDTLSYARSRLFDPIGIGEVDWRKDPQGFYIGGTDLWMSAEDMARFGLLYLRKGKWGDSQIVPESWVEASTSRQSEGSYRGGGGEYGYQWWIAALNVSGQRVDAAYALGFAGQFIYVVPEYDLVVVATGQNTQNPFVFRDYMQKYILPPLVE